MTGRLGHVFAAIIVAMALSLAPSARAAITPEDFLASSGAQAFQQQDFGGAVSGFLALLDEHPDDPLILRYIGMSYDRLGQYGEAVAAFDLALAVTPGDIPTLFFLGVSEYNLGSFPRAQAAFNEVAAAAADTDYGASAREFLAAIEANVTQVTAPPEVDRWDAYVQLGAQYDDNVLATPEVFEDGPVENRDSGRVFEYVSAGYTLINSGSWHLRLEGNGYFSQHLDAAFKSNDIQALGAAAMLSYAGSIGAIAVVPAVRYDFRSNFLKTNDFSFGHGVALTIDAGWTDWLKTHVFYRVAIDDFDFDGDEPPITSRDGFAYNAGLIQYIVFEFLNRAGSLSAGYEYSDRNAEGDFFDSYVHTAHGALQLPLPLDLTLDVSGSYGWDHFPNYVSGEDGIVRRTDIYTASAALSRPITDTVSLSFSFSYTREDSDDSNLSYSRKVYALVLGHSF